jgi:hypothetical protein
MRKEWSLIEEIFHSWFALFVFEPSVSFFSLFFHVFRYIHVARAERSAGT